MRLTVSITKENIYKDLINDYENSILKLQTSLTTAKTPEEISKTVKLLEQYKDQLSKLKKTIE
jgi:hypothetical protein